MDEKETTIPDYRKGDVDVIGQLQAANKTLQAEVKRLEAWQEIHKKDIEKSHDDEIELLGLRDEVKRLKKLLSKAQYWVSNYGYNLDLAMEIEQALKGR